MQNIKQKGYPTLGTILALAVLTTGCVEIEPTPPEITTISDTAVEVTAFSNLWVWPTEEEVTKKAYQGCSTYGKQAIYQGQHCSSHDINTNTYCYGGREASYQYNYSTGTFQYTPSTPETCRTHTSTTCEAVTYVFSCIK